MALVGHELVHNRQETQLYANIDRYRKKLQVPQWGTGHRSMIMPLSDLKEFVLKINASGASLTSAEMRDKLNEEATKRGLTSGKQGVSQATVDQYMELGAQFAEKKDSAAVDEKSYTRATAENSLISMVTNLCAIMNARILVVPEGTAKNP